MVKTLFEKIFIITFTLIICLLILEIGIRISGQALSNTTDDIFDQWDDSYRLKKNVKKITNWPSFSFTNYTNSFGFRDKATGERDITNRQYFVFLGASEVYAMGVNYEDSFVGIFSEYASSHGIEVLNMAIGGHRPIDQFILFKDFIKKVAHMPTKVFICLNELTIPLFNRRHNNIQVKNGFPFDKENWKAAYIRIMLGNMSSAYCFFRDNIRKLQTQYTNVDGKGKSPDFFKIYSKSNSMFQPNTVLLFEKFLNEFEIYCYALNSEPIYVYLPLSDNFRLDELLIQMGEDPKEYNSSYYETLLKDYCKRRNVMFLNLKPILQSYYDKGNTLRFPLDGHYNHDTNRVVGEYFIKKVRLNSD